MPSNNATTLPTQRPRILLRELKKRRHQPKRWDSLPCLKLAPENRPLFVCSGCRFPNVLCSELCPWCLCRCEVAALVAVVRRRLSSPTLLSDAQKEQLAGMESARRVGARGGGHDGDACERKPKEGGTSSHGSVTRCEGSVPVQGEGACEFEPDSQTDTAAADDLSVRRRHRNAVLYSAADVVATPTLDASLQPFLDEIAATHLQNLERRTIQVPSSTPPSTPRKRSARPARPHTTPIRMSPRHGELTEQSEPQTPPSLSPSPLPHTPSLRRKRRMSVLRQRSSCSLRRRATTSGSTATHRRSETAPSAPASPRSKAHSVRFSSPPPSLPTSEPDAFPLGHPQRPLYTAIRKNMSRPSSPAPSMGSGHSAAVDAAFQTTVYERQTRSLDLPRFNSLGRSYLSMAAYTRPVLFPPSASGFSVSGETELRMDLARSRSMDGVPSDFAFRETKPDASTVKAKVKSLGKTLKSLLRGGKA